MEQQQLSFVLKRSKTLSNRSSTKSYKNQGKCIIWWKVPNPQETGLSRVAAKKAYRQAELEPKDINLVEVHDATSFCEIYQLEMLGFCEIGSGGKFIEEGHTQLGGNCLSIYQGDWYQKAIQWARQDYR